MAFGPEFISGLVSELKKFLPLRISKIEGGNFWTALKFMNDKYLLLSWDSGASGCCIADDDDVLALKNLSSVRTSLVETLKSKLLRGGEIYDIEQLNNDRIIKFHVIRRVAAGVSVKYFIILEITEPTANFILLDENLKIYEAARHSSPDRNSFRTILPGNLYAAPPRFNGIDLKNHELNFESVRDLIGIGRPLTRLIQNHWHEHDLLSWRSALFKLAENSQMPCQIVHKNNYLTRFDFIFPEAEFLGDDVINAASFGVLKVLLNKGRSKKLHDIDAKLNRAVKSRERHLDGLKKQLNECENAEIFRKKGEAILAHINEIPAYSDEVNLTTWEGEILKITLDPNLSPSRNAEKYFKKYRKSKNDPELIKNNIASINAAIKEIKEQHDILESIASPNEFDKAAADIIEWLEPEKIKASYKKRKHEDPPHIIYEKDGAVILAGLSARGNRFVIKQARPDDIWLHAHELPGAHVIIKGFKRSELENEKNNILKFAASLAAEHSKGKNSNSVQIDYTERKYIRPVPGTIALVTYINPGTIRITPKSERYI